MKIISAFILLFLCFNVNAQQKVIQLYNGLAPGSEKWTWEEKENDNNKFNTKVVYNVVHPTLTVFLPGASVSATGTAVVVCPGGGFILYPSTVKGLMLQNGWFKKG